MEELSWLITSAGKWREGSLEWTLLAERRGYQDVINPIKVKMEPGPRSDMTMAARVHISLCYRYAKAIATMLYMAHRPTDRNPHSSIEDTRVSGVDVEHDTQ